MPRLIKVGSPLPPFPSDPPASLRGPDWRQARPQHISRALDRALALPSGGWFVLGASRSIRDAPVHFRVDDRELVAWRDAQGRLQVAPDACPHMGARLSDGHVQGDGRVVCPWHGLALGPEGRGAWRCLSAHDDGVLAWVRFDSARPTPAPILPTRPTQFLDAVLHIEARCDPEDVIANRLDPWHGVHFHPTSFSALRVLEATDECLTLRVSKKLLGPLCIEVDATFHCSDPRTIVMTIIAGEGTGSIVETHATPIAPGRTAIIEATLATSHRPGFLHTRRIARLLRPFMLRSARALWVDDLAYAERLFELREQRLRDDARATRRTGA